MLGMTLRQQSIDSITITYIDMHVHKVLT